MKRSVIKKTFVLFLVALTFFLFSSNLSALSSSEIDAQISSKKNEMQSLNSNIAAIQKQISNLSTNYNISQNQLNSLKSQINDLIHQISDSENSLAEIKTQSDEKTSEINNLIANIQNNINSLAEYNRINSSSKFLPLKNDYESAMFQLDQIIELQNSQEDNLIDERTKMNRVNDDLTSAISKFKSQKDELSKSQDLIANKLSELNSQLNQQASAKQSIQSMVQGIQSTIKQLTEEQKIALQKEKEILEAATKNPYKEPQIFNKGEFYFEGRGRDLYDGHSVGMSQWGAYGAGYKGMDYKTIITKYYTGTNVSGDYSNKTINVAGYGVMNIEDYLSGIGEIPDKACQTDSNKGKDYVVADDPNNTWDCWPEEAIKAQIVAARSYALGSIASNPNMAVATDATFQVYKGGKAKKWAADSTHGQIVTNGSGKILTTYYTSSMRGHSEDNELFWTSKSVSSKSIDDLKGTAESYLRGIDDSAWAYQNQYYNFRWKTNSMSLATLTKILKPTTGDIGLITEIKTYTGSSNRIWALTITGEKGVRYVTGWKFKSELNDYLYENTKDSNFVFSTEFTINEVK